MQFLHETLNLGRAGHAANSKHPLPDDWPWPPSSSAPALASRLTEGLEAFSDSAQVCAVALAVLNPVCSRLARDKKPLSRETCAAAASALRRHAKAEDVQLNGLQLFLLATSPTAPEWTRVANRSRLAEAGAAELASAALAEFAEAPAVARASAAALRRMLSFSSLDRAKIRRAAVEAGALEAARTVAKLHANSGAQSPRVCR